MSPFAIEKHDVRLILSVLSRWGNAASPQTGH